MQLATDNSYAGANMSWLCIKKYKHLYIMRKIRRKKTLHSTQRQNISFEYEVIVRNPSFNIYFEMNSIPISSTTYDYFMQVNDKSTKYLIFY